MASVDPETGGVMRAHTSIVVFPYPMVLRYLVTVDSSSRDAGPIPSSPPKSIVRTILPRPLTIGRAGVNATAGIKDLGS